MVQSSLGGIWGLACQEFVGFGGENAILAAPNFDRRNGMKTLEMAVQGKTLITFTSLKLTTSLWRIAPSSFVKSASGNVYLFHNARTGIRINLECVTIEYPTLKGKNDIIFHNVF